MTLGIFAVVNAQGQDDGSKGINLVKVPEGIEKHFVDDSRGGEGILKNVLMTFDGEYGNTKFEVDISESGKYYMTAWVMGISGQDKIQAYLDDEAHPIGYLKISENSWQSAQLQNNNTFSPIYLSKGTHVFSFRSQEVPAIEFIRLAKQEDAAIIPDTKYRNYINTLKVKSLPDNYKQLKSYDWESKPGGGMRTFHPRYALRGNAYGDVANYYKQTGTYASGVSSQTIEFNREYPGGSQAGIQYQI